MTVLYVKQDRGMRGSLWCYSFIFTEQSRKAGRKAGDHVTDIAVLDSKGAYAGAKRSMRRIVGGRTQT